MEDYGEAFVGIDVAKLRNAIAIAEGAGRERFASSARSTHQPPACDGSFRGSLAALIMCISARGRSDRLWPLPPDPVARTRMHCGCTVADPKKAWGSNYRIDSDEIFASIR